MGCCSPVAELLGVLQSLSVASQSCPVHLAACLMASCLCRGQQRGRRARERGHLWAVSSAHPLSGQPWRPVPLLTRSPLPCSPTWQWFRDGSPLPDGRNSYSVSNKERTLTLPSASPDDNGLYYCCARSAAGFVCSHDNFTLNVIGELCPSSYPALLTASPLLQGNPQAGGTSLCKD